MDIDVNDQWSPQDYVEGSFIQNQVVDFYFDKIKLNPGDKVLDVGSGDGRHTALVADVVRQGSVLGIDSSQKMIDFAKSLYPDAENMSFQCLHIENANFKEEFDCVVSFGCLHWSEIIVKAVQKIYDSLKFGGRLYAIVSSDLVNPFGYTFSQVRNSGRFPSLENFVPPIRLEPLKHLESLLEQIPFTKLNVEKNPVILTLSSLDVFRKHIFSIPFFQGQIPPEEIELIADAMVQEFAAMCDRKYKGKLYYVTRPYFIRAVKA